MLLRWQHLLKHLNFTSLWGYNSLPQMTITSFPRHRWRFKFTSLIMESLRCHFFIFSFKRAKRAFWDTKSKLLQFYQPKLKSFEFGPIWKYEYWLINENDLIWLKLKTDRFRPGTKMKKAQFRKRSNFRKMKTIWFQATI